MSYLTCIAHHVMMHLVMQMKAKKSDPTKPLTVRLPAGEYDYLKEYADKHRVSLNWLAAEAIAEYRSKIERGQAIADIQAFQERLKDGRREGGDSVDLLHQLRETHGRLENEHIEQAGEAAHRLRPGRNEGNVR